MLLPLITVLQGVEKLFDVCHSCYDATKKKQFFGPGHQLGRDGFKRFCTHLRYRHNARCSPLEAEIPKKTQSIAARIFSDIMNDGDEYDRQAFGILTQVGIQCRLERNRFGLRPRDTILNGRVPRSFQITNLHDGIWNALEATVGAR